MLHQYSILVIESLSYIVKAAYELFSPGPHWPQLKEIEIDLIEDDQHKTISRTHRNHYFVP